MVLVFDPIFVILGVISYAVMIIISTFLANKVVGKFAGKFSLYTSMLIISILIVSIFSVSVYIAIDVLTNYSENYGFQWFYTILGMVIISNILIYFISPYIINITYKTQKNEYLQRLVDDIKRRVGYNGKIEARVFEGIPNAFAYGNIITGKYVAVSKSLMDIMDENELKSVIGHEIGHHKHKDNAIMFLFGILPSILYYFGYSIIYSSIYYRDRNKGVSILIGLGLIIVSVIVEILVLAFSRLREYYADYTGALATNKESMQRALAKIHIIYKENSYISQHLKKSSMKTLFIYALTNTLANPFVDITKHDIDRIKNEKYNTIMEILSTHPPIPKRLRNLENIGNLK